jgi:hypothetical protein
MTYGLTINGESVTTTESLEKTHCRSPIPFGLQRNIDDFTVLVNGSP